MLSPLLFIAVLDLINRKTVVKDAVKKRLYADDLGPYACWPDSSPVRGYLLSGG